MKTDQQSRARPKRAYRAVAAVVVVPAILCLTTGGGGGGGEQTNMVTGIDGVFGPAISVPREHAPGPLPKPRNLIDQTWEEARRKSTGCFQCHAGV